MPRIRTIKPEFFSDSAVVGCSVAARLFFIGSWCHADDNGILRDDMRQLGLQVFPGDRIDGEALRGELVAARLWVPFEAEGAAWLLVRGFCRHQVVDRPMPCNPLPPAPLLAELGYSTREKSFPHGGRLYTINVLVDDRSSSVRRVVVERSRRKGRERKGKEGNGKEGNGRVPEKEGEAACRPF